MISVDNSLTTATGDIGIKRPYGTSSAKVCVLIILGMFLMMRFWGDGNVMKNYNGALMKMRHIHEKYAEAGSSGVSSYESTKVVDDDDDGNSTTIISTTPTKNNSNNNNVEPAGDVYPNMTGTAEKAVADIATTKTSPPPNTAPPPTLAPKPTTTTTPTLPPTLKPTIPPDDLELKEFFAPIPKAGGYYAFRMLQLFLDNEPGIAAKLKERQKLPAEERYKIPTDTYCNEGVQYYLGNFKKERWNRHCTMHMDEAWPRYNVRDGRMFPRSQIDHKYTIVRDPLSHVLSMWFHCTESKDHAKKAHLMPPTMDEWLQAWVHARHNKTKYKENDKFSCYHPLDFQADYLEYDEAKGQGKDFLKANFDILGDFSRLQKSICAIYVKNRGHIPKECNCTNRRRLQFDRKDNESHGVVHHGSNFNATDAQKALILEQIRPTETKMYAIVQEIFDEQVAELEQKHSFVMCDTFREYG